MSENQFVNADKKKLFTFLGYSWTQDDLLFGELAKEYESLNKDDKNNFRKEIIAQLNTQEEDINFVKTYREIEKKINETHDNEKLKEIYLSDIKQLCQTQKKPKRLEIIDELKLHLSKCKDGEILDFFKSIDGEIDKKSETNKKKILKEIWGRYKKEIEHNMFNPETKKILQLDFVLNAVGALKVVGAVNDEVKKSALKTALKTASNAESKNFLKEVADHARSFDSAPLITTADNDDFLGLGKFLSDVINLGLEAGKAISEFISKAIGDLDFVYNAFKTKKEDKDPFLPKSWEEAEAVDENGKTLLHRASLEGNPELIKKLHNALFELPLTEGFDNFKIKLIQLCNKQDNDGNTALHLASSLDNVAMVNALLTEYSSIDISIKNNEGKTASELTANEDLKSAISCYPPLISNILEEQDFLQKKLGIGALSDKEKLEITQKLLSPFELDEIKLENKEILLDTDNNALEKLESLIQNHPDQNDKLILALKNSDVELARIALDRGADVNATIILNHTEYRPIHYVTTITGNVEMTKLLLEKGADVNALFEGKTSLDDITKKGNQELITLLKSYDAKTNPQIGSPSQSPSRTSSSSGGPSHPSR